MSMDGQLLLGPFKRLREARVRWIIYLAAGLVLAVCSVFPAPYMSRAKFVPGDAGANSLVSVIGALGGGQAQNLASLFGDRGATEVSLQIARSDAVARDVIDRLKLVGPDGRYATERDAELALAKKVDVNSLLGGILEIETKDHDPDFSLAVTKTYVDSIGDRLRTYGRDQVARKRRIVADRLASAQSRLAEAQAALDLFRRQNRLADPQAQLGSQLSLRTNLEAQLQAKQVEMSTLRLTAGPENPRLQFTEQQVATLRQQLADTAASSTSVAGPTMGALTGISLKYANLYRDYLFSQAIYDVYSRSAEEVAVQEMVTQDRSQAAVVDPPHVDVTRYFNTWAVALLGLVMVVALFTEVYAPITGLWERGQRKLVDADAG